MNNYTIDKEKRMKGYYRFSVLIIAALIAIPAGYGQSQNSDNSLSPQEMVNLMIVRETSRLDSVEQKLVALAFIGDLIEQGNTSDELRLALERLSLEGTNVQDRENGRLRNEYPQIRRQAVKYLSSFNTDEAKTALLRVCVADNEPMVLQEAVKSLGIIGIDKNGEVIDTIVWVTNKFYNTVSPDNILAVAAIDAIQRIIQNNNSVRGGAFQLLVKLSEGPYPPSVREKARQAIMDMRNLSAAKTKSQQAQTK
jgi:hypothetical protein